MGPPADLPGPGRSPLVLVVTIHAGEPIHGTVAAGADGVAHRFWGWVELMARINAARRALGDRPPGLDATDTS